MPTASEISPVVFSETEWRSRRLAHECRIRKWTDPHQHRASRGEKHPVYDFLFSYYAFRPAWLRRWHPGPDVALSGAGAREYLQWPEYTEDRAGSGVCLNATALRPQRLEFVRWLRDLLSAMRDRPAFFGCFGLHEWAMIYRQTAEEVRHSSYPLRFSPEDTARIVERNPIGCSHFDAFRFFTVAARDRNRLQPTREDAPKLEQRGCLHANMDLYKWAFKLAPFAPSELIADCFELARDIREVDMRASPYDLRALGFPPIAIETDAGKAEYEGFQRGFTLRGEPLRKHLIALCSRLLAG